MSGHNWKANRPVFVVAVLILLTLCGLSPTAAGGLGPVSSIASNVTTTWFALPRIAKVAYFGPDRCLYAASTRAKSSPLANLSASSERTWVTSRGVLGYLANGAVSEIQLPRGADPQSLVAAPEGVYMAPIYGQDVYLIRNTGEVETINVASSPRSFGDITIDQQGYVRVVVASALTGTDVVSIDRRAQTITATTHLRLWASHIVAVGPDLWFVEPADHTIGIIRDGVATYHSLSNADTIGSIVETPTGVYAGGNSRILRIAGNGAVSSMLVLPGIGSVTALAFNRDHLWYGSEAGAAGWVRVGVEGSMLNTAPINLSGLLESTLITCNSSLAPAE